MIDAQQPGTDHPPIVAGGWHGTLFVQSYRIFGCRPPASVDSVTYWTTVGAGVIFVAFAGVICIVLNCVTLPVGVFAEPIWQRAPKLRRLRVFGGLPMIGISTPVLLAAGMWCNAEAHGLLLTLLPFFATGLLAVLMLGCALFLNRIRRLATRRMVRGQPTQPG